MKTLKTELIGIEENCNKLKITFKTVSSEPFVFKIEDQVFTITENTDIYKIIFDRFPVIVLEYNMKNIFTERKRVTTDTYIIDVDSIGNFNDFDEFKRFVIRYPSYIRFLELVYRIFTRKPWLFPLYISSFSYEQNVKINQNDIEITIQKIRISNFFKKFTINNKLTLKLSNKNGYVLLKMADIPIIDFGNTITYDEASKILEERPNAILNLLIMLIITLLD